MIWVLLYILVGVACAYFAELENGQRAITEAGYTLFLMALWPIAVGYMVKNLRLIRYKGKVIWRR